MKKFMCSFNSPAFSQPFGVKRFVYMSVEDNIQRQEAEVKTKATEAKSDMERRVSVLDVHLESLTDQQLAEADPAALAAEARNYVNDIAKKPLAGPNSILSEDILKPYRDVVSKAQQEALHSIDVTERIYLARKERIKNAMNEIDKGMEAYAFAKDNFGSGFARIERIFNETYPSMERIKSFRNGVREMQGDIGLNAAAIDAMRTVVKTLEQPEYKDLFISRVARARMEGEIMELENTMPKFNTQVVAADQYVKGLETEAKSNGMSSKNPQEADKLYRQAKEAKAAAIALRGDVKTNEKSTGV